MLPDLRYPVERHLRALNPAATRTEWQLVSPAAALRLVSTCMRTAAPRSVLAALAVPVAAWRPQRAAAIAIAAAAVAAAIGATAAAVAAGRS